MSSKVVDKRKGKNVARLLFSVSKHKGKNAARLLLSVCKRKGKNAARLLCNAKAKTPAVFLSPCCRVCAVSDGAQATPFPVQPARTCEGPRTHRFQPSSSSSSSSPLRRLRSGDGDLDFGAGFVLGSAVFKGTTGDTGAAATAGDAESEGWSADDARSEPGREGIQDIVTLPTSGSSEPAASACAQPRSAWSALSKERQARLFRRSPGSKLDRKVARG